MKFSEDFFHYSQLYLPNENVGLVDPRDLKAFLKSDMAPNLVPIDNYAYV